MLTIREETVGDHEAIRHVTAQAFMASEFGHNGEADLIDGLRENAGEFFSYVACEDDRIVGHILFTPVNVTRKSDPITGVGLAPMSVVPDRQRQGIGRALVNEGLKGVFAHGCPFVVVLGHPEYYPKFGFEPASQFGVTHGFDGIPQELFFVKLNSKVATGIGLENGKAWFGAEFGPQHASTEGYSRETEMTGEEILELYADGQRSFEDTDFLKYLNLDGQELAGITFRNCWLDGNFSKSNLENARFEDCCIKTVFFQGSNLKNAIVHRCNIDAVEMEGAILDGADFTGSTAYSSVYKPGELPPQ